MHQDALSDVQPSALSRHATVEPPTSHIPQSKPRRGCRVSHIAPVFLGLKRVSFALGEPNGPTIQHPFGGTR